MKIVMDLTPTLIRSLLSGDVDIFALDKGGTLPYMEEQSIQAQADKTVRVAFLDLVRRNCGGQTAPDISLAAPNPFSDARAKEIIKDSLAAKEKKPPLTMVDVIRQIPANRLVRAARTDDALQTAILRAYESLPKNLWGTPEADDAVEAVWNVFRKSGG